MLNSKRLPPAHEFKETRHTPENILGAQFAMPLPLAGDETIATLRRGTLEPPPFVGRGRRQAAKPLDAL